MSAPLDAETQRHLDDVRRHATLLAGSLKDASEAGIPPGIIVPQLVVVFRQMFGEMPPQLVQQLSALGLPQ